MPNVTYTGDAIGSPWGARSVNGYVEGWLVYSDNTRNNLLACSAAATGSMEIINSVTTIGDMAFYQCNGLTSVNISNNVASIGYRAFCSCSELVNTTIGNSVTSIGYEAFFDCHGLTNLAIPNSVTSIGSGAFYNCYGLTSLTMSNNVTSIKQNTFSGCSNLTTVEIPNSVTSIGDYAFSGCSGLTSITIPNGVTSIGRSAFYGCNGLTSIEIPNTVTSIGKSAFSSCTGLTNIYNYATTPQNIDNDVFYNVNLSSCALHIPCGTFALYQEADVWKDFGTITGGTATITWVIGETATTDEVNCGTIPSYSGATPTKPATPKYTYTFKGWTPDIVAVTGDATYTAKFDSVKIVYPVNITPTDPNIEIHGTVDIDGTPNYGDTITLTPQPEDGWYFDGWSDGNTDNPREIEVTGDVNVYPIFKQCEEIVVNITEVIVKGSSYDFNGTLLSQRGTYSDTLVLANGCDSIVVLKLNVRKPAKYNLRVEISEESGEEMGSVTGAGTYTEGQQVTVTATPASNRYIFVRWYNADPDENGQIINIYDNPYTFTLNDHQTLRAVFRRARK